MRLQIKIESDLESVTHEELERFQPRRPVGHQYTVVGVADDEIKRLECLCNRFVFQKNAFVQMATEALQVSRPAPEINYLEHAAVEADRNYHLYFAAMALILRAKFPEIPGDVDVEVGLRAGWTVVWCHSSDEEKKEYRH